MVYKVWHLLPSLQLKGYRQFWFRLIICSLFGHLMLLLPAFFWHKNENVKFTVFARNRPVEVVFMPLYKRAPAAAKKINLAQSNPARKAIIKTKPDDSRKSLVKKIDPKKNTPKNKPVVKKTDLKLKSKPVKFSETVKPLVPSSKPIIMPKEEPKKTSVIENKQVIKPEQDKQISTDLNEPIYIGRSDLKDLQIMQELQAVIAQNWLPPVGFGEDITCVIELRVDAIGKFDCEIKKSSGVLVYDLSVRRALTQIEIPKSVYQKTLTLIFKQ